LRNVTEFRSHQLSLLPHVMARDRRSPTRRMRQPTQHPDRCRLTCTIGAEKSEDRSGCDRERNVPHGLNVAETLAQLVEHDHRFTHLRNVIAMAEQDLQPGDVPLEVCA